MKKTNHAEGRGACAISARFRCLLVAATLFFSCFGMKAAAQSGTLPKVSIDLQNTAITDVFQSIQQQTGLSFVYNTSDINPSQKVSISAENTDLSAVLDKLFAKDGIVYTIKDKHIVLSKKLDKPAPQARGGEFRAL